MSAGIGGAAFAFTARMRQNCICYCRLVRSRGRVIVKGTK